MIERIPRASAISRDAFHDLLAQWYEESAEGETIGDGSKYGGNDWIWVKFLGNRYHLSADTTRDGVRAYLSLLEAHPKMPWAVVPNERGNPNKVAFGPDRIVYPGFYLYRAT